MEENQKKLTVFDKRIHEIDLFRGFLILLVVIDHIFVTIANYSGPWGWNNDALYGFFYCWYYQGVLREVIQPIVLMLFCFVSGVSCAFSRNNLKRALETIGVAALIAGLTHIMQLLVDNNIITILTGYYIIDFNIIAVLGLSMLIYALIQKKSWRALVITILVSFLLSSYLIPNLRECLVDNFGYYDATDPNNFSRPGCFYRIPKFIIPLFWEPVYSNGNLTADYVPLFPYAMFFFLGALFSYFFYKEKRQSLVPHKGEWERPICFLGRHTMIIYFGQIIVIFGIFAAIDAIVKAAA